MYSHSPLSSCTVYHTHIQTCAQAEARFISEGIALDEYRHGAASKVAVREYLSDLYDAGTDRVAVRCVESAAEDTGAVSLDAKPAEARSTVDSGAALRQLEEREAEWATILSEVEEGR